MNTNEILTSKHQVRTLEVQSFCVHAYQKPLGVTFVPPTTDGQVADIRCGDLHTVRAFDWHPREDAKHSARGETVICVHGVLRNANDFDFLAETLSIDGYRVVCPDLPGRGRSDDLNNPHHYSYPQYYVDASVLIAAVGDQAVDWIGTSLGGVLGLMLAAEPKTPIRRLVMNDVGAGIVPRAVRDFIATYACTDPHFENSEVGKDALAAYLMKIYSAWNLPSEQWKKISRVSYREIDNHTIRLAFDPKLGQKLVFDMDELDQLEAAYTAAGKTSDQIKDTLNAGLLATWATLRCPVLLIHGAQSKVLTDALIAQMKVVSASGHPPLEVVTIPDCGHAPPLMTDEQVQFIQDWLHRTPR